jgi:tripartite-type tricarboxylate transporter receptor subunit TctC
MYKNMPYDSERAFAPILLISSSPMIIVGSPKIPATNFKELIAYAKSNPGKLNASTVGPGSHAHITLELLNKLAGTSIIHVPYRIATQALPDLISGDLQVGFNYIPTFVPNVKAGSIRGLAVASLQRLRDLPDVPTVHESGFPGFESNGWNALLAPAGTPREIIDKVNTVVNAFLKSASGKEQLEKMGMTPIGGTPEELAAHLQRESARFGPIIKEANITLQ